MDVKENIKELEAAQESEHDQREAARESDHFVNKADGMWEPSVISKMGGRPRYTFDLCSPVMDQIMGEMQQAAFECSVRPVNAEGSKKVAQVYDGIIRHIQSVSMASSIYMHAARQMLTTGLGGWRIVHDYIDADSFWQDLYLRPVSNWDSRVWFDPNFELPTAADAEYGFFLTAMPGRAFYKEFPKGSGTSVGQDDYNGVYSYKKPDEVIIGERYQKKYKDRTLILMSDGSVFEQDERFEMLKDELLLNGIEPLRERVRKECTVYSQKFDGADWLEDENETVFKDLPLIPLYGNFQISENKVIYRGVVEKLKDTNRVFNYANSRNIEEGALSPRGKYWMTREQAADNERSLQTLNTNPDPVQFYNHLDGVPPPMYQGAPQTNPGLVQTAEDMKGIMHMVSGMYRSSMGDNPGFQSGVALDNQEDRGNNSTYKYFNMVRDAIQHTGQVLVNAIPRVYDSSRPVRIIHANDSVETVHINTVVIDQQTGQPVELNNLAQGMYELTCTVGPAFHSRQEKTVNHILELGKVMPNVLQMGADIIMNNVNAPQMDALAERARIGMIQAGLIPESQMTEEEKVMARQAQEAQAQQGPSPTDMANLKIAEAETKKAEADTANTISQAQDREKRTALEGQKLALQQQKLALEEQKLNLDAQAKKQDQLMKMIEVQAKELREQAETMKTIKEAIGADAIKSKTAIETYRNQAELVKQAQND